jgi:ligand-binding sensor domain-containing protein
MVIMRGITVILLVVIAFVGFGCATIAPNSYLVDPAQSGSPRGDVTAVETVGDTVVVATHDGLFRKDGEGPWMPVVSVDRETAKSVTSLAVSREELFVGTKNRGLLIIKGDSVEWITASTGYLPDDHVYCVTVENEGEGLAGSNVWVGTAKGVAVRKDGNWEKYSVKDRWLWNLTGASFSRKGNVYVSPRSRLGMDGEDRKSFSPPVTAIAIGESRVALGSRNSKLAVIEDGAFYTVRFDQFDQNVEITSLLLTPTAVWAGTDMGLLWGGLRSKARGKPYPTWRGIFPYRSMVFGTRDTRPFEYAWYHVGYNAATVMDIALDSDEGMWVVFREDLATNTRTAMSRLGSNKTDENIYTFSTETRRYVDIESYIERGAKPYYELYGMKARIAGRPASLAFSGEEGGMWLGTTKGVVNIR